MKISDNALIAAATLSDRYITDRFLPDKACLLYTSGSSKAARVHVQLLQKLRDQALLLRSQGVQAAQQIGRAHV